MENLLFIVPPNISFNEYYTPPSNVKMKVTKEGKHLGQLITDMPLGVMSLASFLRKETGANIQIVDFNTELNLIDNFEWSSFGDYVTEYMKKNINVIPTIVGISALFSPSYQNVLDLGSICRELFPNTLLFAGGNMPTTSYQDIFRDTDCFDAVCNGEGERPLLKVIQAVDKKKVIDETPQWITRDKVERKEVFTHDFIEELDEIPFDYSMIELWKYDINPTIASYSFTKQYDRSFNIMTSRGCPFRCIFCASHRTHGRDMRYHSVDRVKADLRHLREILNIDIVTFEDDHFMGDKQRAYEIVDYVGQLGMTAFFPNSLALYALERKMLEALHRAGVEQLVLAVESGSERVLKKIMKKPLKLSITRQVASDCRDIGIYSDCNILIGLPGETKADIADTRAYLRTINANWFRINVATPLIGSEMFDICVEKDYIQGSAMVGNYKRAIVKTEDFTPEFIQETAYEMNIELNFVNNADVRLGAYETALRGFENALKAKPDHAIAFYYAGICHEKLGRAEQADACFSQARTCADSNTFWGPFIERYEIPIYANGGARVAQGALVNG